MHGSEINCSVFDPSPDTNKRGISQPVKTESRVPYRGILAVFRLESVTQCRVGDCTSGD